MQLDGWNFYAASRRFTTFTIIPRGVPTNRTLPSISLSCQWVFPYRVTTLLWEAPKNR